MKQLKILDNTYYQILIGLLGALALYNLYTAIISGNLWGSLPVLIQSILIYLLISKHPISKIAVKLWVIFAFFGAQGAKLIGMGIQAWTKQMRGDANAWEMITTDRAIYSLIFLLAGVIIWILNNGFGTVVENKASDGKE